MQLESLEDLKSRTGWRQCDRSFRLTIGRYFLPAAQEYARFLQAEAEDLSFRLIQASMIIQDDSGGD